MVIIKKDCTFAALSEKRNLFVVISEQMTNF